MKFLRDALRAVKPTGRIVMLLNDQAPIGEFEAECLRHGFKLSRVATRHLFFEELCVYEASALWQSEAEFHLPVRDGELKRGILKNGNRTAALNRDRLP
jgi:hypothetical protein